jgi:hypothetical protein
MCKYLCEISMFGFLILSSVITLAQKNIIISESLSANSEMLNVKMGSQKFGRIWNFRFGDYAVVKSKLGWTKSKSKSTFWGTKSESITSEKFSFVLCNNNGDTAIVNAANKIEVKSLNEIQILPHFSWGTNEIQKGERLFSANIIVNNDTIDSWTVFIKKTEGSQTGSDFLAFLTNGPRDIKIFPVSSNNELKNSMFPALGYEFVENGQSLSALQYLGSGALGFNKSIVWLDKNMDDRMKLILAAAMTAVLQIETTTVTRAFGG